MRQQGGGNILEYIILGILMKHPMTGYEIRKDIEQSVGMFYKASYGSVYPILKKHLLRGYVSCEEVEGSNRKQKRYTLTPQGQQQFNTWLEEEEVKEDLENSMVRIFFYDRLPVEEVSKRIKNQKVKLEVFRDKLLEQERMYAELPNQESFYYKLSTLYYGIAKIDMMIRWCEAVEKRRSLKKIIL